MATPITRAKNMSCSICGGSVATAWTGLLGTIVLTTCRRGDSAEPAVAGADSTRLAASAP